MRGGTAMDLVRRLLRGANVDQLGNALIPFCLDLNPYGLRLPEPHYPYCLCWRVLPAGVLLWLRYCVTR
jgi:hypothetical protein